MKRVGLFLIIMIIAALSFAAQDYTGKGRVRGVVTDEDGNPLEGAKVVFLFTETQTGFETLSDAKGEWRASWIKGGTWHIDISKMGYETRKFSFQVQDRKTNPLIETSLKKTEALAFSDEVKEELVKGNAFFEKEQYKEAMGVFLSIIETNPDLYIINQSIGNCCFQMEDYDQAEEYYLKVLAEEPDNEDALLAVGNCYQNREDFEKAMEWYGKIEFENISDPVILFNIGTGYFRSGNQAEALKYYKRSIEIQSDFLDGIYQLAIVYLSMDQKESALAEFENYLKIDPDSARADQVRSFIEYLKK